MLAKIDGDLRVKASFITTGISQHYDAIRLQIINRMEGEVDAQNFLFRDIFSNTPMAKSAYIWDDYGTVEWYGGAPGSYDLGHLTAQIGKILVRKIHLYPLLTSRWNLNLPPPARAEGKRKAGGPTHTRRPGSISTGQTIRPAIWKKPLPS